MGVSLKVEGLDKLSQAFDNSTTLVHGGVKVEGDSVGYALTWEFGKIDINPGPKTMWSENALGEEVVLTTQAPHGYIRLNRDEYIRIIQEELKGVNWSAYAFSEWPALVKAVADRAADRCTQLIVQYAPIDTGNLIFDIQPAKHDDPVLAHGDDRALDLGSF